MFVVRMGEMATLPRRDAVELLFLGDSITQAWERAGRYSWNRYYAGRSPANFGIDGDRTQNVLWRLRAGNVEGLSPRLVVLLIGTNNSESNSAREVVEGVEAILVELRDRLPEANVLLLAVFPKDPNPKSAVRLRVSEINARLPALAHDERVHFLDIGHVFLEPDGRIARDVMPDGLHLSAKGFKLWAAAMEPTLVELLGEE